MYTRSQLIKIAVTKAGEAVQNASPSEGVIEKEGRANIVTAADLNSEKILMNLIKEHFPGDEVLSEETTSNIKDPLKSEHLWVIDPIDGTNNFRYQRNFSAVSVGYVEKGDIKIGAAYDPFRKELFFAEKGQGAFVNDRKIHVGEVKELSKAHTCTGNSYDPKGTQKILRMVADIEPTPWVMILGSAVLEMCDVACGRLDLFFHEFVKPWDNAAAFLLVTEAGGVIKNFKGETPHFTSSQIVMGNEALVDQFIKAIQK